MLRPFWQFVGVIFVFIAPALAAAQEIELIAKVSLPGDATDQSGLTEMLASDLPHNRLGGFSGIEFLGGDRYLILSDRGPGDGATNYACRIHEATLTLGQLGTANAKINVTTTRLLRDGKGYSLVGSLAALGNSPEKQGLRFDPEGIRRAPSGTIWLSDEYGPSISRFDEQGRRVASLLLPERFKVKHLSEEPGQEDKCNQMGRQENRGLEGLAISPHGKKLFALMQGPLIQDGGAIDEKGERTGLNCRLLEVDIQSGATREFVYSLDGVNNGLNEILAINDHTFLVIERDGKAGLEAKTKKIYLIDLEHAIDVSSTEHLPSEAFAAELAVKKKLLLDLLDPRFGLSGESFPAKIEGLTFGPTLADGRRMLVISVDNDFVAEQPSWIYFFAIPGDRLTEFGWKY